MKKCIKCGNITPPEEFPIALSPVLEGRGLVCFSCIDKLIATTDNINMVEEVCRHLGLAFFPDEWFRLAEEWNGVPTKHYFRLWEDVEWQNKNDWREMAELWRERIKTGSAIEEVDVMKDAHYEKLSRKWRVQRSTLGYEDLLWLENYEQSMCSDYNIKGRDKLDQLRKICKISFLLENALDVGDDIKDLMKAYNDLMKVAAFEENQTAMSGHISSISEMVKMFEDRGFKPRFYRNEKKDIVDETLADMQEFTRRLILGEPTLPDIVAQKMRKADLNVVSAEEEIYNSIGDKEHLDSAIAEKEQQKEKSAALVNELLEIEEDEEEDEEDELIKKLQRQQAPVRSKEERNDLIDKLISNIESEDW